VIALLGASASAGPSGNPTVWYAQSAGGADGSRVVVLDAATGEPYLLATLTPASTGATPQAR
jgi:hypothetical protein